MISVRNFSEIKRDLLRVRIDMFIYQIHLMLNKKHPKFIVINLIYVNCNSIDVICNLNEAKSH
jgi:hypothetical protein